MGEQGTQGAAGLPAPYLDAARLAALLPPAEALSAIQNFFATHTRESVAVPARIHLPVPGQDTVGLYMPAASGEYVGVKLVHLMPRRFPSVEAEVFLYDAETGKLLFWGDGKPLTALRTAAVSTAASLRIKRHCRTLAVYGAGVQAAAHITAFAGAYPELETVWAVTRSAASLARLQQALPPALRARLRRATSAAEALAGADCIVTTTPAPAPLFDWAGVSPEAHVVGIGSATAEMNELPPQAFVEGAVWVDTSNALKEAGDLMRAREHGWEPSRLAGDLFDLLAPGYDPGPAIAGAAGRRTVFKSVGHAAQDLAILTHIQARLQAAAGH